MSALQLCDVLNFKDAIEILSPHLIRADNDIHPFKISQVEAVQLTYMRSKNRFEKYLKQCPKDEKADEFLSIFRIQEVELDTPSLLWILFRLYNFYVFHLYEFDTTTDSMEVITIYFEHIFTYEVNKQLGNNNDMSLQLSLRGYCKLAVGLCLQVPVLPMPNLQKTITSRLNNIHGYMGNVYPKSILMTNCQESVNSFSRRKAEFIKYSTLTFSHHSHQFGKVRNESEIQRAFNSNFIDLLSAVLRRRFPETLVGQNYIRQAQFNETGIRTIPDVTIELDESIVIPFELKYTNIGAAFEELKSAGGNFNRRCLDFFNIFTQIVRQCITVKSGIGIICDYNVSILIDLRNAFLIPSFYKKDAGNILRPLHCKFIEFRNDRNLSPSTMILCSIEEYGCNYSSEISKSLHEFDESLIMDSKQEEKFTKLSYTFMNKILNSLDYSTNRINVSLGENKFRDYMESNPPSAEAVFHVEMEVINKTLEVDLLPSDLQGWYILKGIGNWQSLKLAELLRIYEVEKIISTPENQKSFGTVLLIRRRDDGTRFIIKFYDPYRSIINKYYQGDFCKSLIICFSWFVREVLVYTELKSNVAPKIFSYGCLQIDTKLNNLGKILEAHMPAVGGYFMILEYIDGCTLDEIPMTEELNVKVKDAVYMLHSEGIYHLDLHTKNILVQKIGQELVIKIIDFGSSNMATLRRVLDPTAANRWLAERLPPNSDSAAKIKRDIDDLKPCLFPF